MTLHEVVKALRYVRDVLKEYVATEERKRGEAKKRAEEVARRQAEELAAREAEMKAAQERLLAQQAAKSTGRRRPRRGDGPRASTPIESAPSLMTAQADAFAAPPTDWGAAEATHQPGLPKGLVALMTQIGRLEAALRDLFTVTERSRAWFEKISTDKRWGPGLQGLIVGLTIVAVRVTQRMFRRDRLLAWDRERAKHVERLAPSVDGGWREHVRYLLWLNGEHQDRQAAMAA